MWMGDDQAAVSAGSYCDDDLRAVWPVAANAPTPAVDRPVVTMFAGKRTVGHSRSRIRFAIAYGLIACVVPTELLRRLPVVDADG